MSEEKKISIEDLEELFDDDNTSTTSRISLSDFKPLVILNLRWFAVSVVVCLLIAGAYLYWGKPSVIITGKMQLQESKKESGMSASLAALSSSIPFGLGSGIGGGTSGDAEMEIMKSTLMIRDVVTDLNLHTEYRFSSWGRSKLLYNDQPVNVSLDKTHLDWFDNELPLTVHKIELKIRKNADGYTVDGTLIANKEETDLPSQQFANLPATVKTDVGTITIIDNKFLAPKHQTLYADGYTIKVTIVPPMVAANSFLKKLEIEPASKKVSTILALSLKDESAIRGIAFIDKLAEVYNRRANEFKNEQLMKTDAFVNERLAKVDVELGSSDAEWENSKVRYQVTDPSVDAEDVITKRSEYESQLVNFGTQIQLQDYLSEYVNNAANLFELIPVNVGVYGGDAIPMINHHNSLVTQRKEMLKSLSEKSPAVKRITSTIEELHPSIQTAMARDRQSLLIKRQTVEREYNKYNGRVSNAPKMERALTEIGRQRNIKQSVYLVMLQKREETAMELANIAEKGKLIDQTQVDPTSASPKKKVVLLAAVLLGFFIPFGILLFIKLFRSTVVTRQDIESLTSLPVIGTIPPGDDSEAIRTLRTNLMQSLKPDYKVILIASEADGDGKTYIANQLATSLASINKKALCLNLDLRDGRDQKAHPADYLASDEFANKIKELRESYDYVILDSPSISRFNDAYQIAQYADTTCYVVKAGITSKAIVSSLEKNQRLPNLSIIINAIDISKKKFRYLYKYCSVVFLSAIMLTSCGSTEKVAYFQNHQSIDLALSKGLYDAKIMPKDILQIRVFTMTSVASEPFNLIKGITQTGSTVNQDESSVYNYLVDNDGNISFPIIGTLHLGGMTKNQAEDFIKSKIAPYLASEENPIVHVRMVNYKYTVIGEVNRPGMFTAKNEKINIIEALAQAGDLTLFGERDKIFLIRENAEGQKEYHQLNINDASIISSPYYYLQQNDIVYVEPNKSKARNAYFSTASSMWLTITSALMSITTLVIAIAK